MPTHRTDGRSNISETRYDGFGRPREALDPLGNRSTVEYDNHSNPAVRKLFGAAGILLADKSSACSATETPSATRLPGPMMP